MKTRLKGYGITIVEEAFLKNQKKNLVFHLALSAIFMVVIGDWFVVGLAIGLEAGQIMIHAQYDRENLLEGYIRQELRIWDMVQDLFSWLIIPVLATIV